MAFLADASWATFKSLVQIPQHGDLHGGNVLVDPTNGAAWLIDFGRSGRAHWARDFAELEAAIRVEYGATASWEEWLELETALARQSSLDQPIELSAHVTRVARLTLDQIIEVRFAAARSLNSCPLTIDQPTRQYLGALVLTLANYFRLHRLLGDGQKKRRVELAVALLAERLRSGL